MYFVTAALPHRARGLVEVSGCAAACGANSRLSCESCRERLSTHRTGGGNMNASGLSNEVNASCSPCVARSYWRAAIVTAIGSLAICLAAGVSVAKAKGGPDDGQDFRAQTLSAPANLVSGGNVLVQITFKHANKNHPLV